MSVEEYAPIAAPLIFVAAMFLIGWLFIQVLEFVSNLPFWLGGILIGSLLYFFFFMTIVHMPPP